jgi:hypothetical protein
MIGTQQNGKKIKMCTIIGKCTYVRETNNKLVQVHTITNVDKSIIFAIDINVKIHTCSWTYVACPFFFNLQVTNKIINIVLLTSKKSRG